MEYDAIIVGGGPAGLAFARALAGSGLRLALIEQQPIEALADPRNDGREIALTHRSVAILQALDAWAQIDPAQIAPLREARILNGMSHFALAFDTLGRSEDRLGQLVPNHQIRRALFWAAQDQSRLDIFAGTQVEAVRTSRAEARVTLADGRTMTARLLVAADSRFSFVRRQLGIAAEINRLGRSMMVCRVAHEADHHGIATEWFDYAQTIAMLPLNGGLSSAVITLPSHAIDRLMALDAHALGAEITRRYRNRLGPMQVIDRPHAYPLATTYAHHFVTTRAALVGDAAVGMHPVTAHGFNLGLRGASRLAELVVEAARSDRDIGGNGLLRRYETAHRLATRPLYAATNLLVGLYTDDRAAARLMRHATLRVGARFPLARRAVAGLLMQR